MTSCNLVDEYQGTWRQFQKNTVFITTKEGIKTLRIPKKVIRLLTGINKYESCKQKFKENRILTVTSIYVLEMLCYIKKYKGDLKHNCEIHEYNTRSKYDLHTQSRNISLLQNSVLHVGVRLYKCLPLKMKKNLIILINLGKK